MGFLANFLGRDQRPLTSTRRDATGGGWANNAGMGGPTDMSQQTVWLPGDPVNQALADDLLAFNGIARTIASREPQDCTRAGYDITEMDAGVADALEQVVEGGRSGEGLGASALVAEARTWARAYGGGAVVMLVDDGRAPDEPIDRANIRRVRGLLSATRWELPVMRWGRDISEARTFGKPQIYRLNLQRGGAGQQVNVHADRVIRIRGLELPRPLQLRRQGWDGSVFDLVFAPLRDLQASLRMVPEALRMLSQGVLTTPSLANALEGADGATAHHARLKVFQQTRGTFNIASLGESEKYEEHARSIAGIKDAIEALEDALVANADGMPRLVLLSKPTAGLSNTDKGELQVWYDHCASQHKPIYTPAISEIIRLVMLSHEGPTGGQQLPFSIVWRSLWQASESTQAATDLARAQRRAVDISSMVVTPAQAQQGDPSVRELYELEPTAPAPTAEGPTAEPEQESLETAVSSVSELALNGAQMKGLGDFVIAFNENGITYEQGVGLIGSSIPSLRGNESRVLGSDPGPSTPAAGPVEGMPDQQVTPDNDAALVEAAPSAEPIPDDLVSTKQIQELFGMPANTINMLMTSGKLPYWGLGKHRRVSMAAVQEASTAHRRQAEEPEGEPE